MSFSFRWPHFSDKFHAETTDMLTNALNKGNKPPIIEDKIEVVELYMGTQPPELEIRDIGDLTTDQFRGIFKLSYSGDAHIVLRTKVQANPLHHKKPGMDLLGGSRRILAAHQPLVVPMNLRLSNFRLNAYVVLVVSKTKGITLVFKTDPLQNVDVSSTFDSIAVIQKYIQKEIEGQLREMFREDLPAIIHKLSQRWIPGNSKIETPYSQTHQPLSAKESQRLETMSAPGHGRHPIHVPIYRFPTVGLRPGLVPRSSSLAGMNFTGQSPRSQSPLSQSPVFLPRRAFTASHAPSSLPSRSLPPSPPDIDDTESTFPELEKYDPTYGMRPEGVPTKSAYANFGRLFQSPRGLADLAEEPDSSRAMDDEIDCTERSFDPLGWNDGTVDGSVVGSGVYDSPPTEYDTIPAIGGGTITRPRILHAASYGSPRTFSPIPTPSLGHASRYSPSLVDAHGSVTASQSPLRHQWDERDAGEMQLGISAQTYNNPHRANSSAPGPSRPRMTRALQTGRYAYSEREEDSTYEPLNVAHEFGAPSLHTHQNHSPDSSFRSYSSSGAITHSLSTPPSSEPHAPEPDIGDAALTGNPSDPFQRRRGSISLMAVHPFDDDSLLDPTARISHELEPSPSAIHPLRPGLNSAAHLTTLSHSNHTLSPFTRSLEHFTVRSGLHVRARPDTAGYPSPAEPRAPVKARRKRTLYLGGKKKNTPDRPPSPDFEHPSPLSSPPLSPGAPSEFSEVDHYFAATTSSLRRRPSHPYSSDMY